MTDGPTTPPPEGPTDDPWAWARDPDVEQVASVVPGQTEQDWEWAHRQPAAAQAIIDPDQVVALLVVHQAEGWLERTLRALASMPLRPGLVVAVDTGSTDASLDLLDKALASGTLDRVVAAGNLAGFGAAVEAGLASLSDDEADQGRWLWLLHDDLEPQPEALEQLLLRASEDDHPDLLFPKLLQPRRRNYPDQLAEIGSSVRPGGTRHLWVSPGEIDQGQAESRPVLGGSTAGLLVRRESYRQLDGFDPELPLFRDGQDFGWRANLAGLRVVTAPMAGLYHRQAGRFGERESALTTDAATSDRRWGMRMVAAHAPNPSRALGGMRLGAVGRGVGYLLGKSPGDAMGEFRAAARAGADRSVIRSMAERRASEGAPAVAPGIRPTSRQRWAARFDHLTHSAGQTWRDLRERDSDTSLDDLIGDDFSGGRRQARLVTPGRVLLLGMIAVALVLWRGMWGAGRLTSTDLAPAPTSLRQAWQLWLHPIPGQDGANPGWLALTALGSTLTAGQPEVFARLFVLGAPLVGALLSYRLARRILGEGWLAVCLSLLWPAVALLTGTTFRGSISGALATVVLPLVAAAVHRTFAQPPDLPWSERLRAPASAALWIGLVAQASPIFVIVGLGVAVWLLLTSPRGERIVDRVPSALVLTLGPALMVAPWLPRLWQNPGRVLVGSDPTLSTVNFLPVWHILLGRPSPDGTPPVAVSAVAACALLAVLLLGGLLGRRRLAPAALAGFALSAGLSLAVAAWSTRLLLTIDGYQVRPSAEPAVLVAGGLIIMLALLSLRPLEPHRKASLTAGQAVCAAMALLMAALAVGWAAASVQRGPLQVRPDPLPGYVASVQDSSRATRTLVIDVAPDTEAVVGHRWTLTSHRRPGWGAGEAHPAFGSGSATTAVASLAAQIAQGTPSDDLAARLSSYGIGHVVVRHGPDVAMSQIANAPGIAGSQPDSSTTVWTVQGLPSRASTMTNGQWQGLPNAQLPQPGQLRIAEPSDPRWRVSVGGTPVGVTPDPSGFGLLATTPDTGQLRWAIAPVWWSVVAHGVVLLALVVLAAPTVGRAGSTAPARAERSAL